MNETLRQKLAELGLSEDHITKLTVEGVGSDADMAMLTSSEVKQITGCGLITAKKVAVVFAPTVPLAPSMTAATAPVELVSPNAEIPEGNAPSPAQVNSFATSLGIDPSMMTAFMFSGMTGGGGMDMDISAMLPIPQIVSGYNPKRRDMVYMFMGQLEKRLGSPIVVINHDGSVNHALTIKYVNDLDEGREAAEDDVYYDDDSTPYEVVRVGVDAQSVYDGDPLVPGKALQKSGMGTGRVNWNGVSLEVRQVAYYAATVTHELDPANDTHVAWLRDHVKSASNRLVFQGLCPKALSVFNDKSRTGELPNLRVTLSRGPRRTEVMPRRRRVTPRGDLVAGVGRTEDDL